MPTMRISKAEARLITYRRRYGHVHRHNDVFGFGWIEHTHLVKRTNKYGQHRHRYKNTASLAWSW